MSQTFKVYIAKHCFLIHLNNFHFPSSLLHSCEHLIVSFSKCLCCFSLNFFVLWVWTFLYPTFLTRVLYFVCVNYLFVYFAQFYLGFWIFFYTYMNHLNIKNINPSWYLQWRTIWLVVASKSKFIQDKFCLLLGFISNNYLYFPYDYSLSVIITSPFQTLLFLYLIFILTFHSSSLLGYLGNNTTYSTQTLSSLTQSTSYKNLRWILLLSQF